MTTSTTTDRDGWRTVDIVVTAVLGVAFGVVFAGWNVITLPLFSGAVNPLAYLVSGVWLAPAVLAGLIVRRPGAAVFAEVVAAAVSAILGSAWGMDAILSGAIQGAGAELAFALFLYRSFSLPVAMLAGAGAAVGEWLHDMPIYYPDLEFGVQLAIGAFMLVSGVLIAGLGSWLLVRALARTGVLNAFPAGREQQPEA
ncbi:MAG TPA: ECF transporter S component [Candidatus Limnocylindria bacterium]